MSWGDVINNKHNADSDHYVKQKIGPMVSVYHRENLEYLIDECERLLNEEGKGKNKDEAKRLEIGRKAVKDLRELLLSIKPSEWRKGVIFEWALAIAMKKGMDKLGFRILRNYGMINQLHEILERHLSGVSENDE